MATTDERLKKVQDEARMDRAMDNREVTENRELSDDDRLAMFQNAFFQEHLPDLPKIQGYHVCWCTTSNPRDSIQSRIRLGYVPVSPADVPGWEYATIKTGEYAGMVGVNEMIALKLPERLYQKYMTSDFHDAPRAEEEKLIDPRRFIEAANRLGASQEPYLQEASGNAELRTSPKVPRWVP